MSNKKIYHCPWCNLTLDRFSRMAPGVYTRKIMDEGGALYVTCVPGCREASVVLFSDDDEMILVRFTEEMLKEMDPATRTEFLGQFGRRDSAKSFQDFLEGPNKADP